MNVETELLLENANDDLKEVLEEIIEDLVDSHCEAWKDRYYRKGLDSIRTDLYCNHDPSLEYEAVEEKLDRELTDEENKIVFKYFNESVLDEFR